MCAKNTIILPGFGTGYAFICNVSNVIVRPQISSAPVTAIVRPRGFLGSLLAWDSLLFALICSLDMVSTVYLVRHGMAREGNPMLAYFYRMGEAHFVAAKLMSYVPTLVITAIFRDRYEKLVALCLRSVIAAYIAIYLVSVLGQFH